MHLFLLIVGAVEAVDAHGADLDRLSERLSNLTPCENKKVRER